MDLWSTSAKRWDEQKLQQYLSSEDADQTRRMYIPHQNINDETVWHSTKDGEYYVKSGYWLSTHFPEAVISQPPYGNPVLKARIWKTSILPKLKHFLWRILLEEQDVYLADQVMWIGRVRI
ncbi:hypothetical protein V5N11_003894 [Cardamine amara subsp. amara]|uniref:Reverse transcriptase zinc-binding domain-containing protein n=1 Tax=Cardamine amara subsp. amara TaxID=228776 RepID=A0ABD0Z1J6_CARAN